MTLPASFPAFLATKRDDTVERGPSTLSADDLPEGEVTIRVVRSAPVLDALLAGRAVGRTVVRLR